MNFALRCSWWAGTLLWLCCGPSSADLSICNRTSYVLSAATARVTASDITSQGWTRLTPGACRVAISGELTNPAYFVYARSSAAHGGAARAWGGNRAICVRSDNFTSRVPLSSHDCQSDNFFALPFSAIATNRRTSWTTTLTETSSIATLDEAKVAGLKRLLRDLGYKIGAIDGRADNVVQAALADFRKRQRLSSAVSDVDMFDALETGALKSVTPAGFALCNDTAKAVAAAVGEKTGGIWTSRGWWKIATGNCAQLTTSPLATDSIYLFVQKVAGPALVAGREQFCVVDIEFEIQGRLHCRTRGLNEIGFAQTRVTGEAGYRAHVGESGLLQATSRYTAMVK